MNVDFGFTESVLMEESINEIKSIFASKTDEEIERATSVHAAKVNRVSLQQYAIHLWKQKWQDTNMDVLSSNDTSNNYLKRNSEAAQFVQALFLEKSFFNHPSFGDDLIIKIFAFLCNDDRLIHTSLIKLSKRFNTIIKNNYLSRLFGYRPNFNQFMFQTRKNVNKKRGKTVDCRLGDGYWISNVRISNNVVAYNIYKEDDNPVHAQYDYIVDCYHANIRSTAENLHNQRLQKDQIIAWCEKLTGSPADL